MGKKSNDFHYIDNWDEYFHTVAEAVARKSKDKESRVGAVIVSKDRVILSTGYNGFARGVYDDKNLYSDRDEKLPLICHAEANAILNAARIGVSLKGSKIYVNKFPCLSCCNAIIQAGIVRIYTHAFEYWDNDPDDKSHDLKKKVLKQARIEVIAPLHPDFIPNETVDGQQVLMDLRKKTETARKKRAARKKNAGRKSSTNRKTSTSGKTRRRSNGGGARKT